MAGDFSHHKPGGGGTTRMAAAVFRFGLQDSGVKSPLIATARSNFRIVILPAMLPTINFHMYICVYIYIHMYACVYTHVYKYVYMSRYSIIYRNITPDSSMI